MEEILLLNCILKLDSVVLEAWVSPDLLLVPPTAYAHLFPALQGTAYDKCYSFTQQVPSADVRLAVVKGTQKRTTAALMEFTFKQIGRILKFKK